MLPSRTFLVPFLSPLLSSLSFHCFQRVGVHSNGVAFMKSRVDDACSTTPSSKCEQRSVAPLLPSEAKTTNSQNQIAHPGRAFRDRKRTAAAIKIIHLGKDRAANILCPTRSVSNASCMFAVTWTRPRDPSRRNCSILHIELYEKRPETRVDRRSF